MALTNVRTFRTEREAVNFAIADRFSDLTNYNLEKPGAGPFNRQQIETLLRASNYREYPRFAFDIRHQREKDHCVTQLVPRTQNPRVLDILRDFVKRPKQKEMYVDQRHRDFHQDVAGPVKVFMQSNLLTLLVIEEHAHVHATEFTGKDINGRNVSVDQVVQALEAYVRQYYAPIRLEWTNNGEYRFDGAHIADPLNPHNFGHLHVYHMIRNYHTTIRLERG